MTFKQDVLLYFAAARIMLHRLIRKPPEPVVWNEARFLCIGLDGAGKTCLLRRAADATAIPEGVEPTNGFKVRSVVIEPNCKAEVWDIGGREAIRPYWSKYATHDTEATIWVLDGADEARLAEARGALREALTRSVLLRSLPLLVLVSKQDSAGAMSADVAAAGLGLEELQRERLAMGARRVEAVSAVDGRNLASALQWLARVALGEEEEGAPAASSI